MAKELCLKIKLQGKFMIKICDLPKSLIKILGQKKLILSCGIIEANMDKISMVWDIGVCSFHKPHAILNILSILQ